MAKHIFILSGSHKQAANFARDKGLHPSSWTFLHNPSQLMGLRCGIYIKTGTWCYQRSIREIDSMLSQREFKECYDVRI